jgi:hypothetical protein
VIVGTAGVLLLVGGSTLYWIAKHSATQHTESAERLATALFDIADNRPLLPTKSTQAFEAWSNEIAWAVYDATDRKLFPHERDIAEALRDLNAAETLCPRGNLLGLSKVERLLKKKLIAEALTP